jgi:beta-lactamase regulating signal transducer with metallopeptidase domain
MNSLMESPALIVLLKWTWLLAMGWVIHLILHRSHARWRLILWRSILCFGVLLPLLHFSGAPVIRIPVHIHSAHAPGLAVPAVPLTSFNQVSAVGNQAQENPKIPRPQIPSNHIGWKSVIMAAWFIGCAFSVIRLIRLHLALSRLRKNSCPSAPALRQMTAQLRVGLHVHRQIDVRVSDSITSPFVCGMLNPSILLPSQLVQRLTPEELAALLSHEIAHLCRHDLGWCVAWQWMKALYWFHPLVWNVPAAHNFACDQEADLNAASQLGDQDCYAQMLARLALRVLALPAVETTLALNGSSQIARRLKLLGSEGMSAWDWRYSSAAFALAGLLFLVTAGSGFSEAPEVPAGGTQASVTPAAGGQAAIPGKDTRYPDTYGVYLFDGNTFTPLYSGFLGKDNADQKQHLTFPENISVVVFEKWLADPKANTDAIVMWDWRHLGEKPMPEIPVVKQSIENHPDMILIIPKQPLNAGLYSVQTKVDVPDYLFGVETPDMVPFWSSVLEANPTNWQAHNHLGAELYMRGDIKGAYPHFLKATQLNPQNPESHNNLALALSYLGKTDEAIKEYETAVKLKDDSAIVTNLANAYEEAKRYDDAVKTYRHALELNPTNASAHCNLGYALMQQGKVDEAIPEFQKAIELDPSMPQAKTNLEQAQRLQSGKR